MPWGKERRIPGDQILRRSLIWVNEEGGFAIVVHMVLTMWTLGVVLWRMLVETAAFQEPRFGGTDFVYLVDDFYYVGARDRMIFPFSRGSFKYLTSCCIRAHLLYLSADAERQAEAF